MQELFKLCSICGAQNDLSAQFCQACNAQSFPITKARPKQKFTTSLLFKCGVVIFGCCAVIGIISMIREDRPAPPKGVLLTNGPTSTPTSTPTLAPVLSPAEQIPEQSEPAPESQLAAVQVRWERSGSGAAVIWRVNLKNNTARPIGDIQYRTTYYSETGNVLGKGGVDSALAKKIVQKVIPPKATRTVEIEDGITHPEVHRAHFQLVSWRFVADKR
jgi:hypothetical protein